jgi:hypothetical protein
MASKNRLELTFNKPSKRWKKTTNGRVHYFGYGSSRSDRHGYKKAVERYRRFLDEQEKADQPRLLEIACWATPSLSLSLTAEVRCDRQWPE